MPHSTTIKDLHAAYCRLTGFALTLGFDREYKWSQLTRLGVTVADLELVIARIQAGVRAGARYSGALKFRNLIADPDHFEEELAEARAFARKPKGDPARAAALRATGRDPHTSHSSHKPQTPAQIMAEHETMAKLLRDFKKDL